MHQDTISSSFRRKKATTHIPWKERERDKRRLLSTMTNSTLMTKHERVGKSLKQKLAWTF